MREFEDKGVLEEITGYQRNRIFLYTPYRDPFREHVADEEQDAIEAGSSAEAYPAQGTDLRGRPERVAGVLTVSPPTDTIETTAGG